MPKISVFQPIGDAASELRALLPDLDHTTAVAVLREAEEFGFTESTDHHGTVSVSFIQHEGWEVIAL